MSCGSNSVATSSTVQATGSVCLTRMCIDLTVGRSHASTVVAGDELCSRRSTDRMRRSLHGLHLFLAPFSTLHTFT